MLTAFLVGKVRLFFLWWYNDYLIFTLDVLTAGSVSRKDGIDNIAILLQQGGINTGSYYLHHQINQAISIYIFLVYHKLVLSSYSYGCSGKVNAIWVHACRIEAHL